MEGNKRKLLGFQFLINSFLFVLSAIGGFILLQRTHLIPVHTRKVLAMETHITIPTPTTTPTPSPTSIPTPTPTYIPTPTPQPTTDPTDDRVWDRLAQCEAGGNWAEDTGNGYYGGLQFNQSAWESVGGSGNPAQASRTEQISRGKMLQAQRGWSPWSACSKELGLN